MTDLCHVVEVRSSCIFPSSHTLLYNKCSFTPNTSNFPILNSFISSLLFPVTRYVFVVFIGVILKSVVTLHKCQSKTCSFARPRRRVVQTQLAPQTTVGINTYASDDGLYKQLPPQTAGRINTLHLRRRVV